jgi:hypothetical protein
LDNNENDVDENNENENESEEETESEDDRDNILNVAHGEIGRCHGKRYGPGREWCSEFVSWCLRNSKPFDGVPPDVHDNAPTGSINSGDLLSHFGRSNRVKSGSDVRCRKYELKQGDYLQVYVKKGNKKVNHSCIFVGYCDEEGEPLKSKPTNLRGKVFILTIDGNTSLKGDRKGEKGVDFVVRTLDRVKKVGMCGYTPKPTGN